jgi:glycerate-2-kinase
MNYREIAEQIFLAGVKGVMPGTLVADSLSFRGPVFKAGFHSYDLDRFKNIYILGAGKASAALGHYVEKLLGDRIRTGHIVTKYGFYVRLERIKVTEAGHPVPDVNSFTATRQIIELAQNAGEDDLVICILSGGGSSLLADYPSSSSPGEMMLFNDMLVRCGAGISEMNTVRKHLSGVKGGHLARHIWPATSVTFYLSDVPGDAPEVVASGPTVPDHSTFSDAMNIIDKYGIRNDMPASLLSHIENGIGGIIPDTPKPGDPVFSRSAVLLAGNNRTALRSAEEEARKMEFSAEIVTGDLTGDVADASSFITEKIIHYRNNTDLPQPVCLLFGGETTVRVTGDGLGGRNQHLALMMALKLQEIPGVTFLSAGTDGNDGNTEMAGAVADTETIHDALAMNVDPERFLREFDSYNFFRSAGGHVFTGPTMTNVMDLAVAIIE